MACLFVLRLFCSFLRAVAELLAQHPLQMRIELDVLDLLLLLLLLQLQLLVAMVVVKAQLLSGCLPGALHGLLR